MSEIKYTLGISDADAHLIDVQLQVTEPDPAGQLLTLPNWIPGSYMIRDFSRNIVTIRAQSEQGEVALRKVDKSSWQAPAGLSELTVIYRVYAWDLSVRAAHVDRTHAFYNGTSVFLAVEGFESMPHQVVIQRPLHDVDRRWKVATTLPCLDTDPSGFGSYEAADYDELIDHPVESGDFQRLSFTACGVPHEVVFNGGCYFDEQRVTNDLQKICEYEIRFFGEPAPYERYLFLVMVVDAGYGGLEHRSSTALMITPDSLPVRGEAAVSDTYLSFLGLCSHEYFHNWNVKKIKPERFVPYQLQAESYTQLLWFFEGMTSYYDDLILVRCGLISPERYLTVLAKTLTRVQRGPGRLSQTVTDSSFDAWHKFYKQDENAPNAIVSYYAKGALIALCLDSLMRQHSGGKLTLDDLMIKLWQAWLAGQRGIGETEPQTIVAELLGEDVSSFFQSALYTTDELPLIDALSHLGVALNFRARTSSDDVGGHNSKSADNEGDSSGDVTDGTTDGAYWLGANVADAPGGVRITHVLTGSPAQRAGLSAGDIVIAMAGFSVSKSALDKQLARFAEKRCIAVHYFRLGELFDTSLSIERAPADTASLVIENDKRVADWLGQSVTA